MFLDKPVQLVAVRMLLELCQEFLYGKQQPAIIIDVRAENDLLCRVLSFQICSLAFGGIDQRIDAQIIGENRRLARCKTVKRFVGIFGSWQGAS